MKGKIQMKVMFKQTGALKYSDQQSIRT